jgi:hypothetical protein
MNPIILQLLQIEKLIKESNGWPFMPILRTHEDFKTSRAVKRILNETAVEKGFEHYSHVGVYCGTALCLLFIEAAIERAECQELIQYNAGPFEYVI